MDFHHLPQRFAKSRLYRCELKKNPIDQLACWFAKAQSKSIDQYNAMCLATASRSGVPSCRTVLVKELTQQGLVIFTHYQSRKGQEIEENPLFMGTIFWKELMFQIQLEGHVRKLGQQESEKYFQTRSRGSQISAWASSQGKRVKSRETLLAEHERVAKKFEGKTLSLPPFWGGYHLLPYRVEFWSGGKDRIHDRFEYVLVGTEWEICRISP